MPQGPPQALQVTNRLVKRNEELAEENVQLLKAPQSFDSKLSARFQSSFTRSWRH